MLEDQMFQFEPGDSRIIEINLNPLLILLTVASTIVLFLLWVFGVTRLWCVGIPCAVAITLVGITWVLEKINRRKKRLSRDAPGTGG